jgi:UDP-N-acetylmuramyl pentapeptide synthase
MYQSIKRFFYFPVASYFRFFASMRLKKWHPRIVVITGSSGKTTLLHLIESQLGGEARYSHEANSSFGIPFDILNIHRRDLTFMEWPAIFILPWIKIFGPVPKEKIYIVEADCDRPYEGRFLSEFLKPEVTLWTNVSRTHSMNFDGLVAGGKFGRVEEAIAYEYGYFAEETRRLLLIPAGSVLISRQLDRVKCKVEEVESSKKPIEYTSKYLLPKATATSFEMCLRLTDYLRIKPDKTFSNFRLPPGRSSVFKGIKGTTIVDSTYNANLDSMSEIIAMFATVKAGSKWVVLGDMLEQGKEEKEEHEKLAKLILKYKFDKVILMGSRITKYTKPLLPPDTVSFLGPKEVLDYLRANIAGGETILFKGARFLEGVVENLLLNQKEAKYLARREKVWEIRRKKWGL